MALFLGCTGDLTESLETFLHNSLSFSYLLSDTRAVSEQPIKKKYKKYPTHPRCSWNRITVGRYPEIQYESCHMSCWPLSKSAKQNQGSYPPTPFTLLTWSHSNKVVTGIIIDKNKALPTSIITFSMFCTWNSSDKNRKSAIQAITGDWTWNRIKWIVVGQNINITIYCNQKGKLYDYQYTGTKDWYFYIFNIIYIIIHNVCSHSKQISPQTSHEWR